MQFKCNFDEDATQMQPRSNSDAIQIILRYNSDTTQMQPIANHCSLPSLSFGQVIGKLQGKVVTQFEELGWWSFSMVDCVTLFLTILPNIGFYGANWPSYMNIVPNWSYRVLNYENLPKQLSYEVIETTRILCSPVCTWKSVVWSFSQKRVTQSTIEKLHQPSSSECVTPFT